MKSSNETLGILENLSNMWGCADALSPLDLIPDFIPILGVLDDLILLPGLMWLAIHLIPAQVRRRSQMPPRHVEAAAKCCQLVACMRLKHSL